MVTLGVMVQVSNAFSRVHGGFALFYIIGQQLLNLEVFGNRLSEFERNLEIYKKGITSIE